MDRKKKDDLPKMQVGFIDFICMPVYKVRILFEYFSAGGILLAFKISTKNLSILVIVFCEKRQEDYFC